MTHAHKPTHTHTHTLAYNTTLCGVVRSCTHLSTSVRDMTHSVVTGLIYIGHDSFTRDVTCPYVTLLVHTALHYVE